MRQWLCLRNLQPWLALAGFSLLSLLLRLTAFPRSVIDWDESVFLLMGRALLRGEIPYTTVWEHSPIGAAVLFAAAQWLFGESVLAIRILTWLAVSLTCWLLYMLANELAGRGRVAGVVAGVSYAVYSLNNGGQSAHRELFFAPLVVGAVWLLLRARSETPGSPGRRATGTLLLAGFLLGAGLQLKYLYIWDWAGVAAIAAILTLVEHPGAWRNRIVEIVRAIALLAVGPVAFVGAATLYFVLNGHLADFIQANFAVAVAYVGHEPFAVGLLVRKVRFQITGNMLAWLGLFLAPLYLLGARDLSRRHRQNFLYMGIWFCFALVDAVFTRWLFGHYFLQVLPPLSVLLGLVVVGVLAPVAASQRWVLLLLILLGPLLPRAYPEFVGSARVFYQRVVAGEPAAADTPTVVARYLRQQVRPGETLFVIDYEPIVYYLVDAEAPTRYLFTIHLTDETFAATDGIDQPREVDAAFARKPTYVVRRTPRHGTFTNMEVAALVEARLRQSYALEAALPGADVLSGDPITVEIFRRRD